jgi:hypothetical protein
VNRSFLRGAFRLAAAVDAFLLKIAIEEGLGYPVQLISDGLMIESALGLTGIQSVYESLAASKVDIYPEARRLKGPSLDLWPAVVRIIGSLLPMLVGVHAGG